MKNDDTLAVGFIFIAAIMMVGTLVLLAANSSTKTSCHTHSTKLHSNWESSMSSIKRK